MTQEIIVTCAAGAESVLEAELTSLGVNPHGTGGGARTFEGKLEDAYRVALWSRIASRVLIVLERFDAPDETALYDAVRAIRWEEHISARETLAIDCVVSRERKGAHTRFLSLKTKDAIVDRLRDKLGDRPNVDRDAPDMALRLRWADPCTLLLDIRGALHRRGYRPRGAAAPLRENLAAALLAMSGWQPDQPLVDPMCGSGTFLVEAAWIARDVAPGLGAGPLGGWFGHDPAAYERLVAEARDRKAASADRALQMWGFDADPRAIATTREAMRNAGISLPVDMKDMRDLTPPTETPGHLVINPPYGERLGARGPREDDKSVEAMRGEMVVLYGRIGDALKQRWGGWTAHVLSPVELVRSIGLKPARRHEVFNGPIDCRLATFPMVARVAASSSLRWHADAEPFANRLRKNLKKLGKWAKSANLDGFRVYDADIKEYNVAVDIVGDDVVVSEYSRPRKIDARTADARLRDVMRIVPAVLDVDERRVHLRVRARQGGGQYDKRSAVGERRQLREGDHRFHVNVSDYLDMGLFPDQRRLRAQAAEAATDKRLLNLFAYTCTASVYAAARGAITTSVDLSNTYLAWGEDNFRLNDLDPSKHEFIKADVIRYLERTSEQWHVVYLNPPSYSRSKGMQREFIAQRDHAPLIDAAMLATREVLYFSTHARGFTLDPSVAERYEVRELSKIVPRDYARSPFLAWTMRHR